MKILLISYYYPPCGGAAVQRWLRFSQALIKLGHSLTVITTQDGDYPYRDESLMLKIPGTVKVLRSKPLGFGKLWKAFGQNELPYGSLKTDRHDSRTKKLLYWLRLNLVVPDLRIGWNPSAYRIAVQELRIDSYDYVITTGPPHSTHLIGLKLKKRFRVQWRTDFRDPMSDIYYLKLNPPSRLTRYAHKYLEKKIIQAADLNYIVSHSIAQSLPEGKKRVLYNGFDPEDFSGFVYGRSEKFRIKFAGQLTAGQDPSPLLEALKSLIELSELELSLIGTRDFPTSEIPIRRIGFLPHLESLNELVNAELLVLFINSYEGNQGMLTTKLFEYLASRTPILCIGQADGEAAHLIGKCKAGVVLQNSAQIAEHLKQMFSAWKIGQDQRCQGDIGFLDVNRQVLELTCEIASCNPLSEDKTECVE